MVKRAHSRRTARARALVGLRQNINMDAETTSGPLPLKQKMKGERGKEQTKKQRNGKFSSNRGTPQCGQIDIV